MRDEFVLRMIESFSEVHTEQYFQFVKKHVKRFNSVLDIGCGPGLLLEQICERFNPGSVTGIDLRPEMLEESKIRLKSFGKPYSLIKQHLQEDTNLHGKYSVIFASRVLRSFENLDDVLKAIHSSLVDGGYLVILDWDQQPVKTYFEYFEQSSSFQRLTVGEKIRRRRNFSWYSSKDWEFMCNLFSFNFIATMRISPVHISMIFQKN